MRILFSLVDFRDIGGAQLYFLELGRALIRRGHSCSLISNIQGPLNQKALDIGIRTMEYKELRDLSIHDYDIIHASHVSNMQDIIQNDILPGVPIVQTCHSEIIPLEDPVNHWRVNAYIAIRKTIYDKILQSGISAEKVHLIFNPIDTSRFNIEYDHTEGKKFLFAGSIDFLRKNALELCYKRFSEEQGYTAIVAGRIDYPELAGKMPRAIFVGPVNDVERLIKQSEFVAGIQEGRTKWEAGFCGKKYFDIKVDAQGRILGSDQEPAYIPDEELMKYSSEYVAEQIERLYMEFIKK
jgi:glycosyltransferase involved in cell wall biosynthesis